MQSIVMSATYVMYFSYMLSNSG